MRQFRVVVNGREYCVEVDEMNKLDSVMSDMEEKYESKTLQDEANESQHIEPLSIAIAGESKTITAPLAGSILSVRVKEGEYVKAGDVVLTLEALKLENEIITPYSGVVRSVTVTVGQNVEAGKVLVAIDETELT